MNIFLVGNGFDLHHDFPTSYYDFLQTILFLLESYDESMETVGKVFGHSALQARSKSIQKCCQKHGKVYNATVLPKKEIVDMVEQAKHNMWIFYLSKCVTRDIHWIDFEKEILRVLKAFDRFFDYRDGVMLYDEELLFNLAVFPSDPEDNYIMRHFDYFYERVAWSPNSEQMRIRSAYMAERVIGSGAYVLAKDGITAVLYQSLRELADLLKKYLWYFVDEPSRMYAQKEIAPYWPKLPVPHYVYSFNYTNTFEILYGAKNVSHIHGNTENEIVLGINPDERDMSGSVDTTFLQFKKYFQRVFFETDSGFMKTIESLGRSPYNKENALIVIGHSLDSTDEDMIRKIFDSVQKITIYYHNENSVKNQIKNLVEIYGKEGLDQLRERRLLQFSKQPEIVWGS